MMSSDSRAPDVRPIPLRYRCLSRLLWPLLALLSWRQGITANDPTLLPQRLARELAPEPVDLWVHCASVGEVNTAAPLIDALLASGHRIALSVITATGAATARERFGEALQVRYLPIDTAAGCRRFLNALQPRLGLMVETEIWPHLYTEAKRRGTTLAVVNARLSPRTRNPPRLLRPVLTHTVSLIDRVLARNADDADAWQSLGVPGTRVSVVGNLKFAALGTLDPNPVRLLSSPYWLAASTHPTEERRLVEAWLRTPVPRTHTLVIAPRHVHRATDIQTELQTLGVTAARVSTGDTINADTDVVIANTFGDLNAWYAHADAVFVGGSLVPVGGHNLLEPAMHARWISTGPELHNFKEEADLLQEAAGLTVVDDANAVVHAITRALINDPERLQQGLNAQAAVTAVTAVLPAYLAAIDALYAASNDRQSA